MTKEEIQERIDGMTEHWRAFTRQLYEKAIENAYGPIDAETGKYANGKTEAEAWMEALEL